MSGPFPEDSAERKTYPVYSGVLQYFPAALAKVAHHSYLGNEKHNPGQALHWARGKSDDHLDAAARHLTEGDKVGAAWRILAALQLDCEAEGASMAPGARVYVEPAKALSGISMEPPVVEFVDDEEPGSLKNGEAYREPENYGGTD